MLLLLTMILQGPCSDWLRNTSAITSPGRLPKIYSIHSDNTVNHLYAYQYDHNYLLSTCELPSLWTVNTVDECREHAYLTHRNI